MLTSEEIHPDHQGPGKDPFKHSLSRIGRLTGASRLEDNGVVLYGDNANLAIVPVAAGILRLKVFFDENAPRSRHDDRHLADSSIRRDRTVRRRGSLHDRFAGPAGGRRQVPFQLQGL
ncbi:hypothetical protein OMP38_08405 [Cohnella ginsengisoli]|uniref:Uncharacterized protein n=1 Tax=Cohnella ginsengisoli TaxID=425004 RepID=A0A9X4KFZ9_9BACL|nr:hypothetical protein [Cohnella ginsengisoli]MDG0790884.1 hypothetical protein [Cohnella ginsengisoli]